MKKLKNATSSLALLLCLPLIISMKVVQIETPIPKVTHPELTSDFLSFAVDLSQVMGKSWWSPEATIDGAMGKYQVPRLDWKNEAFRKWTAPFGGSYLRLGGSIADSIDYVPAELAILGEALDYVKENSMKLVLTANALDSDSQKNILKWNKSKNYPVVMWEFGNEPNAFVLIHGWNGFKKSRNHAKNWIKFRNKVERANLAGPATAFWPMWGEPLSTLWGGTEKFIRETKPSHITWHYYPQQSKRCGVSIRPANLDRLLAPIELDEILVHLKNIKKWRDKFSPSSQIWLGETGNAQCGGEPGVSDRWASSLWWMDQLNLMAHNGVAVVIRQSLHGAHYGLLSEDIENVRPDYWTTLLWKEIIQGSPIPTKHSNSKLRVYLYKTKNGHRFVAVNLSKEDLKLELPVAKKWETWLAEAESLDSKIIKINDQTMPYSTKDSPYIPKGTSSNRLILKGSAILYGRSLE